MDASIFDRHKNVALQFSGGKDSLAVLHLMRPWWDRLTVYYVNPGDAYPETESLMTYVRALVPNFVEVKGRQPEVIREMGWPSDIVPHTATQIGRAASGIGSPLIDRYTCCAQSMMNPMHERMLADGVTLIIRGQKTSDVLKSTVRSGDHLDGFDFLFPIEGWLDEDVLSYLNKICVEIPRFYSAGLSNSPDCMHCTAWLEHKSMSYLRAHYPDVAKTVSTRLREIRISIEPVVNLVQHLG